MTQVFTKNLHIKFAKYLNFKDKAWKYEKKYIEKTKKYIKYIKWIPGLRMIWIWNSISMNWASKDSDIDLYIVTTKNSMWFVRITITFIFQILWVRKNSKKHAWRFCLSFFSTTKWMDFSNFKIENDIYLYFWVIYFKPILDYNNTYKKFIEINSKWANFSNYKDIIEKNKIYISYSKNNYSKTEKTNSILKCINNLLKRIFLPKALKSYKKLGKPFWVIINKNMLKFHDKDIRKKIKEELF